MAWWIQKAATGVAFIGTVTKSLINHEKGNKKKTKKKTQNNEQNTRNTLGVASRRCIMLTVCLPPRQGPIIALSGNFDVLQGFFWIIAGDAFSHLSRADRAAAMPHPISFSRLDPFLI